MRTHAAIQLCFACLIGSVLACSVQAAVIYVKPNASGPEDGTSWDRAYRELRTALPVAQVGDQIWVAQGTYRPTATTNRGWSFVLRTGVSVYGGFSGTETQLQQRNPLLNATILSGDLLQNDSIQNGTQRNDNSYHVVRAQNVDASALLDGFVISGGSGGNGTTGDGAGIIVLSASPSIVQCVFSENLTTVGRGGAAYCGQSSAPFFVNCQFVDNFSWGLGGGAVFCDQSATPSFFRCVFRANHCVGTHGGAVYCSSGSPFFRDCTLENNFAAGTGPGGAAKGGAFFGDGTASGTFEGCLFLGNHTPDASILNDAGDGGAIFSSGTSITVRNCTFLHNRAGRGGAGNSFTSGRNGGSGGAICVRGGTLTVVGCLIAQNRSGMAGAADRGAPGVPGDGGGIHCESPAQIVNSTIANNTSYDVAGGLRIGAGATADIDNSIFWNNRNQFGLNLTAQIGGFVVGASQIDHSCVQFFNASGWGGQGNVFADPLFIAPSADDFRLSETSGCIDAASNFAVPLELTVDADGNPRFLDNPDLQDTGEGVRPIVDMGAYEWQISCLDLDGNDIIDLADLIRLLAHFGTPAGATFADGDFNGDGDVDFSDLTLLLSTYGLSC